MVATGGLGMELCMAHHVPPRSLPGFPDAQRALGKTSLSGNRRRARWRDDIYIYEWDYQHGTVEVYNLRGFHIGEFDPNTGVKIKDATPGRRIDA